MPSQNRTTGNKVSSKKSSIGSSGDLAIWREKCSRLEEEVASLRENLNLLEDLRGKLGTLSERMIMINQISQELNTLDIDKIGDVAVKKVPSLIGAKYCSLFLYDYNNDELILKSHNHSAELTQRIAIKLHRNTIMGLALQRKKIIHIVDVDEYENANNIRFERTFADKYATRTCISAPLLAGNFTVGILNFADKVDGTYFDEVNDLPTVEQLSNILAIAIRNCSLFQEVQSQARTDALTKLANYRAFHEQLRREMHRAVRYSRPLSLIMFDVDGFKEVNDVYGHQGGDYILEEIGNVVRSALRREDLAARYGGDEVAIVLPETSLSGALVVAARIIALIRGSKFTFENKEVKVTISMGVAGFLPNMNVTDFVSAADSALYDAKQKGKDRYEIASAKPQIG